MNEETKRKLRSIFLLPQNDDDSVEEADKRREREEAKRKHEDLDDFA